MFKDRAEAGKLLAEKLHFLKGENAVVLGIPRGGVVVGRALARELELLLDVVVTRKLKAPAQPELAIGAIGPHHTIVLNRTLIEELNVADEYLEDQVKKEEEVVKERAEKYRDNRKEADIKERTVVLVDDGIATGATVEAAIRYLRTKNPKEIILAVPVMPQSSVSEFENLVDKLVILLAPTDFRAVGDYYESFPQVTDEEVLQLLQE